MSNQLAFTIFTSDKTAYVGRLGGERDLLPLLKVKFYDGSTLVALHQDGGVENYHVQRIVSRTSSYDFGYCRLSYEDCDCGECDHCCAAYIQRIVRRGVEVSA